MRKSRPSGKNWRTLKARLKAGNEQLESVRIELRAVRGREIGTENERLKTVRSEISRGEGQLAAIGKRVAELELQAAGDESTRCGSGGAHAKRSKENACENRRERADRVGTGSLHVNEPS